MTTNIFQEVPTLSDVFYMGVDVAKRTLAVNLKDPLKENPLWTNKSVPNNEKGFALIAETAVKKIIAKGYEQPFTIVIGMESTGVYGEQLAHYFDGLQEGFVVYVLNPAAVHSFAQANMTKNKNDSVDARLIASYLAFAVPQHIVSPWVPPTADEVRLQELSKRREDLIQTRTMETNRLEKHQFRVNTPDLVVESVENLIQHLDGEIAAIEKEISDHIDQRPDLKKDVELMRTIPGIGEVASVVIQSETGGLSKFSKVRQLIAFIGLAPSECSSGTSVNKRSHISKKGNSRIRSVLYMCAMSAIRSNSVIKEFYERLTTRGKCKKVAIVACMRKLLCIVWGVVKNAKEFAPEHALQKRT